MSVIQTQTLLAWITIVTVTVDLGKLQLPMQIHHNILIMSLMQFLCNIAVNVSPPTPSAVE